jgi:hypothetical protein
MNTYHICEQKNTPATPLLSSKKSAQKYPPQPYIEVAKNAHRAALICANTTCQYLLRSPYIEAAKNTHRAASICANTTRQHFLCSLYIEAAKNAHRAALIRVNTTRQHSSAALTSRRQKPCANTPPQPLRRGGRNHAPTSPLQPLHRSHETATSLPVKCSGSIRRQGMFLCYKNKNTPQKCTLLKGAFLWRIFPCSARLKNCSEVAIFVG